MCLLTPVRQLNYRLISANTPYYRLLQWLHISHLGLGCYLFVGISPLSGPVCSYAVPISSDATYVVFFHVLLTTTPLSQNINMTMEISHLVCYLGSIWYRSNQNTSLLMFASDQHTDFNVNTTSTGNRQRSLLTYVIGRGEYVVQMYIPVFNAVSSDLF